MPLGLVHGDGVELVKYLASLGLLIGTSHTHHDKLKNYINLSEPQNTIICTDKIGWHGNVFVLSDETIGTHENEIVYQPEYPVAHKLGARELSKSGRIPLIAPVISEDYEIHAPHWY
jgi:putative DNA primase/helicase